jgi:hypothetical protein
MTEEQEHVSKTDQQKTDLPTNNIDDKKRASQEIASQEIEQACEPKKPKPKARIKNMQLENYTDEERSYYLKLAAVSKKQIAAMEEKMKYINNDSVPLRFKVLSSGVDDKLKAAAVQKLNHLYTLDESSSEYCRTHALSAPAGPGRGVTGRQQIQQIQNRIQRSTR